MGQGHEWRHKVLNRTNEKRIKEWDFRIQKANSYLSRLHIWMGMLNGFTTPNTSQTT